MRNGFEFITGLVIIQEGRNPSAYFWKHSTQSIKKKTTLRFNGKYKFLIPS
jgi:hypothetical protein